MTSKPYVVLSTYWPQRWSPRQVGIDLTSLTQSLGLIPISDPHHRHQTKAPWCSIPLCAYVRRRTVRNTRAAGWHQDGDLVAGSEMDDCLVLWSTNTPTELMVGDTVFTPNPREVIIFRNLSCLHRRPTDAPRVRWFFRQRVEIPNHMELP